MVHDFKNTRSTKSLKSSNHLASCNDNSLNESPSSPINTTDISTNPTGITSPPPIHTKRPNKIFKLTRFKFLPKRKPYSNSKLHNDQLTSDTSFTLPHYFCVATNPNDYLLKTTPNYPVNTSSVTYEMDNPVRIYSQTNYSFPLPSFQSDHFDFFTPN